MWILLIPLIIAEILFWIFVAYFAWKTFKAIRNGNRVGMILWGVLLAVPFIFYYYKHFEADLKEAERAEQVAAFERVDISAQRPKLVEVYGHLTEFETLVMLGPLGFDEVVVFQRPHRGEIYGQFIRLAPGCERLGAEKLALWKKRGRFKAPTKEDKACLIGEWKTVSDDRANIDAVEYRHGTQATLLLPGNNWYGGAYEVRLRNDETSRLVRYWERPFITRPLWPGPWGYAYPSNTDRKKYKEPKRLDFFLAALDAH